MTAICKPQRAESKAEVMITEFSSLRTPVARLCAMLLFSLVAGRRVTVELVEGRLRDECRAEERERRSAEKAKHGVGKGGGISGGRRDAKRPQPRGLRIKQRGKQ